MAGTVARGRPGRDLLCFVSGWISAVIAVARTLLGSSVASVLTYVYQQRSSRGQQAWAFSDKLRGERLAAYSGFVTVLNEYNRAQLAWYRGRTEDSARRGDRGGQ